ncbi:MAG: hypothetical protein AB7L76_21365 [Burkholderiaceae bacterium]
MRASVFALLLVVAGALAAGIAMQVDRGERQWTPPEQVPPDPSSLRPASTRPPPRAGVMELAETVERPLFSPTRRPPPPPPPPAPPEPQPEPDPLANLVLLGLYGSGEKGGGAILRADGKVVRVQVGGQVGGWRLVSVDERTVVLTGPRGRRSELVLKHQPQMAAPPVAARAAPPGHPPGQPADGQPPGAAPADGAPTEAAAGDRPPPQPTARPRTTPQGGAARPGTTPPSTAGMTAAERRAVREQLMMQRSQGRN